MNNYASQLIEDSLQLKDKLEKLRRYLETKPMTFDGEWLQSLLEEQEIAMSKYYEILEKRISHGLKDIEFIKNVTEDWVYVKQDIPAGWYTKADMDYHLNVFVSKAEVPPSQVDESEPQYELEYEPTLQDKINLLLTYINNETDAKEVFISQDLYDRLLYGDVIKRTHDDGKALLIQDWLFIVSKAVKSNEICYYLSDGTINFTSYDRFGF